MSEAANDYLPPAAPAVTESVPGRTIPRYRGDPLQHAVRFFRTEIPHPERRDGGVIARCDAGDYETVIDGGHTGRELLRFAIMHETGENP